jgi:alkaline phosphatase
MKGRIMVSLKLHRIYAGIGASLCLLFAACSATIEQPNGQPPAPLAKNVILFIGDGMEISTVTAI